MVPAHYAAGADRRRSPVSQQFGQRTGVFMRNHACHRECKSSVIGRERVSTLKKTHASLILIGRFPSEGVFQRGIHGQTVNCGFDRKDSGFLFVTVMGNFSQGVESDGRASARTKTVVGT